MKKNYLNCKAFALVMLISTGLALDAKAQGCYASSGCSDYSNFGYSSTSAADLEYDNYVSGFHSTIVRDLDGTLKIWGEKSKADGAGHWLVPTPINAGNYPGLTGVPLKVAIGSRGINQPQYLLLTDDNKLWAWGKEGILLDNALTSDSTFQELSVGLPAGVSAMNVKMLYGTNECVAITTCAGEVYILSTVPARRGNGGTGSGSSWSQVEKLSGGYLTSVVAVRGCANGLMALDTAGGLWTWGRFCWTGDGTTSSDRNKAVAMSTPNDTIGAIKMIGAAGAVGDFSYYVLYENGALYSMGANTFSQLGNWNTTAQSTWVVPTYDSLGTMPINDVKWISPNEHDYGFPNINILNEDKVIYNWGRESGGMLGRSASGINVNPGVPLTFEAGYSNADMMVVETGGHTTMTLKKCEDDFGYVGHRVHGSMGDNDSAQYYDVVYHFKTNAVQVCGAEAVDVVLNASVEGPQYIGNTVTLLGTPSGGSYSIAASSTATATLTDSILVFTGAGTLRVDYTAPSSTCSTVTVSKTFNVNTAAAIVTIPGSIWGDANGDALLDTDEAGVNTEMWVNLTDPNGIVIASVKVNPDGTYTFEVSTDDLSVAGNYSIVLTQTSRYSGDLLTAADTATDGYEYTGTNLGGIADVSNETGILNIGDLSTITTATTTAAANFGIQQPPTADVKEYSVSNEAFTNTPPAGFPDISSPGDVWQAIPMSSSALTGTTGGALSGSDPEDCPTASSCSDGATFNIETINSNTRLFYDFGGTTGVVEIDITGGPVEIENFDVTKMIIWGQNGSGAAGDEIGFTYSITDQAGASSDPVSYTIETATPLPVELLSFVAKLQNNNVLLNWATASEVNNKGFEIERSATGNNWSNIGFVGAVTADGNSNAIQNYSFRDSKPSNGMNYYRLKQLDINGKFNYSPVRSVTMQQQASIAIQPNPAKDHIIVKGLAGNETIKIYSMHGRLVKEIVAPGNTAIIVLDELNAGMYHVNVVSASGVVFVSKVIKL